MARQLRIEYEAAFYQVTSRGNHKENYLHQLSRHIHLNPVRSGITTNPMNYKWSSYQEFFRKIRRGLVEIDDTLSYFSEDKNIAIKKYRDFVEIGAIDDRSWLGEIKAGVILPKADIEELKRKCLN